MLYTIQTLISAFCFFSYMYNYFVDFDMQIIIKLFVTLILNLEVAEFSFSEERIDHKN